MYCPFLYDIFASCENDRFDCVEYDIFANAKVIVTDQ